MNQIFLVVFILGCSVYGNYASAQSLSQAFLSRFRKTVNGVSGYPPAPVPTYVRPPYGSPYGTPYGPPYGPPYDTQYIPDNIQPKIDAELQYINPIYGVHTEGAPYAYSDTPVLDTLAAHHEAAAHSPYPVATLLSNAAAVSSQRLGHIISEAPVATAISHTAPRAIQYAAQQVAQQASDYVNQAGDFAAGGEPMPVNDAAPVDELTAALIQSAIDSLAV